MYVRSGAGNTTLSLNFMGKKLRNHMVAPAAKQRAWVTTNPSQNEEGAGPSSRAVQAAPPVRVGAELPGSVPDLREELQYPRPCNMQKTHLDQEADPGSNEAAVSHQVRDSEDEASLDVKIFIPYDSAKLCITQITNDMVAMRTRHLEMVQELEENFLTAAQENQEKAVVRIRAHYQTKLNALKRVLHIYQEKVESRSSLWREEIRSLQCVNKRLQDEQTALQERSRQDSTAWDREKSKMMELFSSRLDLLHNHQASTLQELRMARAEMGHVQELLQTSQQAREATEVKDGSNTEAPLEGAQARLKVLRDGLQKREREISVLMEGGVQSTMAQSPYAHLLAAVVDQAHSVYTEVTEARQQFDQMAESNLKALAEAREGLASSRGETTPTEPTQRKDQLEVSEADHLSAERLCEVTQVALQCIRTGAAPTPQGSVNQGDLAVLDESVKTFEENFRKSDFLNSEPGKSVSQQLLLLQAELKQVKDENKKMVEHYTAERTLRKKYYNMVEDMKGKIRVLCRIRPQTRAELARGTCTIVSCLDDYSVILETPRGPREFQFDRIFSADSTQEEVFQESSRLIQSAIDGFNVCIFAYGQTGSGKTFTMVGDRELKNPGIIPRTFGKIFEIIQENEMKFEFKVSASMLELYNDRLQDLFVSPAEALTKRIDIKKDKKGLVFAQGAESKHAASAGELFALFELGCANRHIAATKMNVESSRSHLIISITLESRNLTNGGVSFGKLNLVDLAGSERAAKTGARDDQLKEANSINKSLSALGDVISALAMEQAHVPYRNNKLTQLMQDSLGGNAKTLMFLNISPSDCNLDETLTSLIYASRVKAITNYAQRNMESKEIAQLKEMILKLKSGQPVEEEDI
ncbi:putative LOC110439812 homolog [Brachyhypopomus gauderio]|uniref:putative LOC110439812 homolog n=1 Tax=Brachyhypopomus gauderio TaxID=698409 RepID=UPI0040430B8E